MTRPPTTGLRCIIAGGRNIREYAIVEAAIEASGFVIAQVVSGVAEGVDRLGEQWGYAHDVPIARFPANWDRYGKRAGILRNGEMAAYAQALVAVWDGRSPGTKNMIAQAHAHDLYISVYRADCVLCGAIHRKDRTCQGAVVDWAARKARALAYTYTNRHGVHSPEYQDYD